MTAELYALAQARHRAGDLDQAERLYRQVLEQDPLHAEALHFLGVLAHQTGDHARALDWLARSVALRPGNALFHGNLAAVHAALGQSAEAVACLRRLVALQPDAADAHYRLANALLQTGDPDEAAAHYRQAVHLQPGHAEAHSNLGVALFDLGRMAEAVASYGRALQARPDYPEALNNLGNALKELGGLDEAVAAFAQALRLRPDFADAHGNLGNVLTARGEVPEALASYRRALALRPDLALVRSNYLLCLNYAPDAQDAELFAEHRRWGELHGREPPELPPHRNDPDPERPLRVGYLADDFGATAFGCFVRPVLAAHDPARVLPFCYQRAPAPAGGAAAVWRSLRGLAPARVAEVVRADGIDVLVDLLGHTRGHGLAVLPYRPAPVQVTWLGYPNTTGLASVAYRLTDAVADPPGGSVCHTEELVRLPGVFCCYGPPAGAPPVGPLPALREGRLTFGSHHNLAKLNPAVLDLWARVLRAVPSARLLLFRDTLRGGARDRLLRQLAGLGVTPDRVETRETAAANLTYLAPYHDVDVVLDAFPWSGHTTTCDALWMGVPVLTLRGSRHAGRMAASVLTAAGLAETVAATPDEFVARAVRLAADVKALAGLRAGLRERVAASALCDAVAFTRGLEDTYRALWRRWRAGGAGG
jgi:predicted O-linked N-acetylglucosamine transferase (SPINDLY family)